MQFNAANCAPFSWPGLALYRQQAMGLKQVVAVIGIAAYLFLSF